MLVRRIKIMKRRKIVIALRAIVISSEARNLYHSRPETHAFPTCAAHLSAVLICLSYRLCPINIRGASLFLCAAPPPLNPLNL